MDRALVVRNGIVLSMEDGAAPPVGGTVVVRGSRLVEVAPASRRIPAEAGAVEIDASGCVVMPGLVNCHAHVRPMRGLGEDMDVMTWHNQYVDGVSARMTPDDAYFGAANAYLEMLRNGTTTVMAMSIIEPDDMRAAVDTGIRARVARHAERRHELEETIALAEKQSGTSEEDRVRLWLGMELPAMFNEEEVHLVGDG